MKETVISYITFYKLFITDLPVGLKGQTQQEKNKKRFSIIIFYKLFITDLPIGLKGQTHQEKNKKRLSIILSKVKLVHNGFAGRFERAASTGEEQETALHHFLHQSHQTERNVVQKTLVSYTQAYIVLRLS